MHTQRTKRFGFKSGGLHKYKTFGSGTFDGNCTVRIAVVELAGFSWVLPNVTTRGKRLRYWPFDPESYANWTNHLTSLFIYRLHLDYLLNSFVTLFLIFFIQFLIDAKITSDEAPATIDDVTPLFMSSSDPDQTPMLFLKARMDPVPFVKVNRTDHHLISPYNINILPGKQVMRIKRNIKMHHK